MQNATTIIARVADVTHIAIVGATGTGKSTLANALKVAESADTASNWEVTEATTLMNALTHDMVSHDTSHCLQAVHQHRKFALTLLTGLDLPMAHLPNVLLQPTWFDQRLRQLMDAQAIPYAVVYGAGQRRTDSAIQAIKQHLGAPSAGPTSGTAWHWACDTCSDADCEHQLFSRLVQQDSVWA